MIKRLNNKELYNEGITWLWDNLMQNINDKKIV